MSLEIGTFYTIKNHHRYATNLLKYPDNYFLDGVQVVILDKILIGERWYYWVSGLENNADVKAYLEEELVPLYLNQEIDDLL